MVRLGLMAQNFDIFEGDGLDKFARTGKISVRHLLNAGSQGVILGHSETEDSPEIINRKLKTLIKENPNLLRIIVLIGETWKEFENNKPQEVALLMKQKCKLIFNEIPRRYINEIIVGYEPKWGSRGSGRDDMSPPQPELISACISEIRKFFEEQYGKEIKAYFIYGGRSNPERTQQILADRNLDGLILGSACNNIKKTLDIAKTMLEVCKDREKILICNFKAYELSDPYERYIEELSRLPKNFIVFLAPPHTDIRLVKELIEKNKN